MILASSSAHRRRRTGGLQRSEPRKPPALTSRRDKATASSCISGYAEHAIEHLNDGQYGNEHSWIAAGEGEQWAQIELAKTVKVARVVFSRDRRREYADRVPTEFEVRLSVNGRQWTTVKRVAGHATVVVRPRSHSFAGWFPILLRRLDSVPTEKSRRHPRRKRSPHRPRTSLVSQTWRSTHPLKSGSGWSTRSSVKSTLG